MKEFHQKGASLLSCLRKLEVEFDYLESLFDASEDIRFDQVGLQCVATRVVIFRNSRQTAGEHSGGAEESILKKEKKARHL